MVCSVHIVLVHITACTVVQLLYKRMAKSMGMGRFRPHTAPKRNRVTNFDEIRTLDVPSKDPHHEKFHFDPTTWVVSANTPFATVRFLSLSFCFFGLFVTRTGRTGGPILTIYTSCDVFLPKDVPFEAFVYMPPNLGGQILPNPQFWGRE